jgi:hypothetical protein
VAHATTVTTVTATKKTVATPKPAHSEQLGDSYSIARRSIIMKQRHFPQFIFSAAIACLSLVFASCGSGVAGTYSDTSGAFVLELRSGGKAQFTFMGQTAACTYAWTEQSSI